MGLHVVYENCGGQEEGFVLRRGTFGEFYLEIVCAVQAVLDAARASLPEFAHSLTMAVEDVELDGLARLARAGQAVCELAAAGEQLVDHFVLCVVNNDFAVNTGPGARGKRKMRTKLSCRSFPIETCWSA